LNGARKEGIEKENSRLRDVERVLKLYPIFYKKYKYIAHVDFI
jgi:hypothetical protein